jgi:hypothetical protein
LSQSQAKDLAKYGLFNLARCFENAGYLKESVAAYTQLVNIAKQVGVGVLLTLSFYLTFHPLVSSYSNMRVVTPLKAYVRFFFFFFNEPTSLCKYMCVFCLFIHLKKELASLAAMTLNDFRKQQKKEEKRKEEAQKEEVPSPHDKDNKDNNDEDEGDEEVGFQMVNMGGAPLSGEGVEDDSGDSDLDLDNDGEEGDDQDRISSDNDDSSEVSEENDKDEEEEEDEDEEESKQVEKDEVKESKPDRDDRVKLRTSFNQDDDEASGSSGDDDSSDGSGSGDSSGEETEEEWGEEAEDEREEREAAERVHKAFVLVILLTCLNMYLSVFSFVSDSNSPSYMFCFF